MKNAPFLLFIIFVSISLSACGVKPSHVEPPIGAEDTAFPRTYPAPSEQR